MTKTSKAANLVRFNIFTSLMKQTKPKLKFDFNVETNKTPYYNEKAKRKRISEDKHGSVNVFVEWIEPIHELFWDTIIQEQRSILAKSDLYKVFGKKGNIGSAALLFKGDVLSFVVWTCIYIYEQISWYPNGEDNKTVGFPKYIIELMHTKYDKKLDEWTKRKIISLFRVNAPTLTPIFTRGNIAGSIEHVVVRFEKKYRFAI